MHPALLYNPEMPSLRLVMLTFLLLNFNPYCSELNAQTPKQKSLNKLIDIIIDPKETENLRRDLLLKIQSGLALTNNSIFEELLQEVQGDKSDLIRKYQTVETQMNHQIVKSFSKHINMTKVVRDINLQIYAEHYTRSEIDNLIKFYSSPLGKKFLRVSKTMIQQTQILSAEILVKLSVKVTDEVQEFMQSEIGKLIKDDLAKDWDQ